jgi:hypothetical protein
MILLYRAESGLLNRFHSRYHARPSAPCSTCSCRPLKYFFTQDSASIVHARRVEYPHLYAFLQQPVDDVDGRGLSDVVGFRFEGQAPDGDGDLGEVFVAIEVVVDDLVCKVVFLALVRPVGRLADLERMVQAFGCLDLAPGRPWESTSRVCPGSQGESGGRCGSPSHPSLTWDVRPNLVAQEASSVHERDLGGENAL